MKIAKYQVTEPWGNHKKGDILNESREVRRKLKEGGCIKPLSTDSKMENKSYSNKMENSGKNKGGN